MAGWTGEERDVIAWDGTLRAINFKGDGSQLTGVTAAPAAETDPLFNAASAAYNTHLASSAIHFIDPGFLTAETDPIFNAASGAYNTHLASSAIHYASGALWSSINANTASAALIGPHIADATIHYASTAIWSAIDLRASSSALTTHTGDDTIHYASGAIWTKMNATSSALSTHLVDSIDPHGANLIQSSMAITADSTASGSAVVRNILIGTEATPASAALYTQGTLYVQYTA